MAESGAGARHLHGALSALQQHNLPTAAGEAAAALEQFTLEGDATGAAAAHQVLAMVAAGRGDLRAALAHVDAAIPLREQTSDQEGLASLYQERFEIALALGDLSGARNALLKQKDAHERAGDREGSAHARHQLAQILLQEGQIDAAESLAQEAIFGLEGPQGARGRSALHLLLANIEVARGTPEKGIRHGKEALDLARQAKFRPGEIDALQQLGAMHGAMGDFAAGRRALEEALVGRELLKDLEGRAQALRELATLEFAAGEVEAGFERLDYAVRTLREAQNFFGEVTLLQLLQAFADEHSRPELGDRAGREMVEAAARTEDAEAIAAAQFALATRLAGAGDLAGARNSFSAAHALHNQAGQAHEAAVSLGMLGQVCAAMGDPVGIEMMKESLAALDGMGSEAADALRPILAELNAGGV
jgi:tetratricopeptide (TPR) repeat protein